MRPLRLRERDLEKYFVRRCKKAGIAQRKFTSPGNRSVHDRILFPKDGEVILLELKRPGEKLTPLQEDFHLLMSSLGYHSYWTDSKEGINEVIELSKDYDRRRFIRAVRRSIHVHEHGQDVECPVDP